MKELVDSQTHVSGYMNRQISHPIVGIILFCVTLTSGSADAALKSTTVERFDVAVAKAVSFLQTMPRPTARDSSLVAYALLKAGVDLSDPRIVEGIAYARQRGNAAEYDQYEESYLAAVDAMLLCDVSPENPKKYREELQRIAHRIVRYQRENGTWHDPNVAGGPTDVSLTQYCILGLWAAKRADCSVPAKCFDRTARFLVNHSNPDGGWPYRITGLTGKNRSTHNMTMAGVGTIAICRLLLWSSPGQTEPGLRFGALERVEEPKQSFGYPNYRPQVSRERMSESISRGLNWNRVRYSPVPPAGHVTYFYYTLERAAALTGLEGDWFTNYGDGLLTLQHEDGHFDGFKKQYGSGIATSFAILFYMQSTREILKYDKGLTIGERGLMDYIFPRQSKNRTIGPLDELLDSLIGQDFDVNDNTDEIVKKVQFTSREELIGEADKLRILVKSPDPANRQIAYWALSRTGDFDLVPLMLDGLHDPNLSVSIQALTGLRYIARRPKGFNLTLSPLSQLPHNADEATRLNTAKVWKDKASRVWREWYSGVRPYATRDGLDEIGLPIGGADR